LEGYIHYLEVESVAFRLAARDMVIKETLESYQEALASR
jgi:hypothetical protein